jgi:(S)-sulfolactate dehydrogenase
MSKVLITEFMDLPAVQSLQSRFDVEYQPDLVDARDELLERLSQADALIVRNRTRVDAELLAAAPWLKVVGRLGVGLDNIDMPACAARAVQVIPAAGANALSVAEYVICASMMLLRGVFQASAAVGAGTWPRAALSAGRESAGKVLGLVGFGGIGQLSARLAQAIGMQVIAHDPMIAPQSPLWRELRVQPKNLDQVFAEADVVSLHIPLTPETRGLVDAERLAMMKQGAVLINTARGGIVDEAALAVALKAGRLAGAALDVFDAEPLAVGSTLVDVPNLVLTPHIAGVAKESNERVSVMIADKVMQALERHG